MVGEPDRRTLTNAYQGPGPNLNPSDRACDFPYQTLPRSMLAVRTPLVFLDWSTNAYQSPDLGRNLPRGCFTNLYHRDGGQGIDVSVAGVVVAGMAVW